MARKNLKNKSILTGKKFIVAASMSVLLLSACGKTEGSESTSASPSSTIVKEATKSPSPKSSPSITPSTSPSPSSPPVASEELTPTPEPSETKESAPKETKEPEPKETKKAAPKETKEPVPKETKKAAIEVIDVKDTTKYTTSGLNVRSGPGTNYKVISTLKSGSKVTVTGTNKNGSWSVIGDGKWVSSSYLSTNKPSAPKKSDSGTSGGKSKESSSDKASSGSGKSYTEYCSGGAVATHSGTSSDIKQLLNAANQERSKLGYAKLSWNGSLASAAQSWSDQMASKNSMTHNPNRPGAENVGVFGYHDGGGEMPKATALNRLHKAWMASEGHCKNIMNPSYTQFGAGMTQTPDGTKWYSTQNFK